MKVGSKVKAKYTDAVGGKILWDGAIVSGEGKGWRVDVGGVAILFDEADLTEMPDGEIGKEVDQTGS